MRHSDTDDGFTSQSLATAEVPPSSSIILELFMKCILGVPKYSCQGIPNILNVRIAYMTTWNERLTIARTARGYNKSELARGASVSNPTVSDWESGEIKKLEGENLLNICEFLQISSRWLLLGKGAMEELVLSNEDLQAVKINRTLGVKERSTWYRVGDSLTEPAEGTNGK